MWTAKSRLRCAVAVLAVVVTGPATSGRAADDIVDTAVANGSFNTLAAAVRAAGLVDALKGAGPFTVFAPTDEAFAKLPAGTVETLLKPENKEQLVGILTYHVVPGKVPASKVVSLNGATTLNGQRVDIKTESGKVTVDQANVVQTDVQCSNGIIHVIDSVILPASDNLVATAKKAGNFGTLLAAAEAAGLADALAGGGPFTVFAPTDDAFAKLPEGTVESLLKPENKDKLVSILKYHVIAGRIYSDAAVDGKEAKTLLGQNVRVSVGDPGTKINDAKLITTDIDASNGVIHVIDSVLLPQDKVSAHEARQMIEHAISSGARLFNAGHHHQCAQIYTETARKIVSFGDRMPTTVTRDLNVALTQASHTHCATQRSWTLRHGLDRAYFAMQSN
ncbi:MAG: fasciclin domain-containing protein [Pirellulaceae bacterium]|nr:fasciclin domain-containing protein [Pirellulaceae bacterium]